MTTKFEYLDHTISLDHNQRFQVTGPLFERAETFDTYAQAQEKIAARKKIESKEGVPQLKLEVIPRTQPDRTVIIDSIHGSTSHLLFKPRIDDPDAVYPVAPFVRDLLKRRVQLKREIVEIDKRLDPLAISTRRGYGRMSSVSKLVEMTNAVMSEHEKVRKLAYDEQEKLNKKVGK